LGRQNKRDRETERERESNFSNFLSYLIWLAWKKKRKYHTYFTKTLFTITGTKEKITKGKGKVSKQDRKLNYSKFLLSQNLTKIDKN
jgi:hypothetical protein